MSVENKELLLRTLALNSFLKAKQGYGSKPPGGVSGPGQNIPLADGNGDTDQDEFLRGTSGSNQLAKASTTRWDFGGESPSLHQPADEPYSAKVAGDFNRFHEPGNSADLVVSKGSMEPDFERDLGYAQSLGARGNDVSMGQGATVQNLESKDPSNAIHVFRATDRSPGSGAGISQGQARSIGIFAGAPSHMNDAARSPEFISGLDSYFNGDEDHVSPLIQKHLGSTVPFKEYGVKDANGHTQHVILSKQGQNGPHEALVISPVREGDTITGYKITRGVDEGVGGSLAGLSIKPAAVGDMYVPGRKQVQTRDGQQVVSYPELPRRHAGQEQFTEQQHLDAAKSMGGMNTRGGGKGRSFKYHGTTFRLPLNQFHTQRVVDWLDKHLAGSDKELWNKLKNGMTEGQAIDAASPGTARDVMAYNLQTGAMALLGKVAKEDSPRGNKAGLLHDLYSYYGAMPDQPAPFTPKQVSSLYSKHPKVDFDNPEGLKDIDRQITTLSDVVNSPELDEDERKIALQRLTNLKQRRGFRGSAQSVGLAQDPTAAQEASRQHNENAIRSYMDVLGPAAGNPILEHGLREAKDAYADLEDHKTRSLLHNLSGNTTLTGLLGDDWQSRYHPGSHNSYSSLVSSLSDELSRKAKTRRAGDYRNMSQRELARELHQMAAPAPGEATHRRQQLEGRAKGLAEDAVKRGETFFHFGMGDSRKNMLRGIAGALEDQAKRWEENGFAPPHLTESFNTPAEMRKAVELLKKSSEENVKAPDLARKLALIINSGGRLSKSDDQLYGGLALAKLVSRHGNGFAHTLEHPFNQGKPPADFDENTDADKQEMRRILGDDVLTHSSWAGQSIDPHEHIKGNLSSETSPVDLSSWEEEIPGQIAGTEHGEAQRKLRAAANFTHELHAAISEMGGKPIGDRKYDPEILTPRDEMRGYDFADVEKGETPALQRIGGAIKALKILYRAGVLDHPLKEAHSAITGASTAELPTVIKDQLKKVSTGPTAHGAGISNLAESLRSVLNQAGEIDPETMRSKALEAIEANKHHLDPSEFDTGEASKQELLDLLHSYASPMSADYYKLNYGKNNTIRNAHNTVNALLNERLNQLPKDSLSSLDKEDRAYDLAHMRSAIGSIKGRMMSHVASRLPMFRPPTSRPVSPRYSDGVEILGKAAPTYQYDTHDKSHVPEQEHVTDQIDTALGGLRDLKELNDYPLILPSQQYSYPDLVQAAGVGNRDVVDELLSVLNEQPSVAQAVEHAVAAAGTPQEKARRAKAVYDIFDRSRKDEAVGNQPYHAVHSLARSAIGDFGDLMTGKLNESGEAETVADRIHGALGDSLNDPSADPNVIMETLDRTLRGLPDHVKAEAQRNGLSHGFQSVDQYYPSEFSNPAATIDPATGQMTSRFNVTPDVVRASGIQPYESNIGDLVSHFVENVHRLANNAVSGATKEVVYATHPDMKEIQELPEANLTREAREMTKQQENLAPVIDQGVQGLQSIHPYNADVDPVTTQVAMQNLLGMVGNESPLGMERVGKRGPQLAKLARDAAGRDQMAVSDARRKLSNLRPIADLASQTITPDTPLEGIPGDLRGSLYQLAQRADQEFIAAQHPDRVRQEYQFELDNQGNPVRERTEDEIQNEIARRSTLPITDPAEYDRQARELISGYLSNHLRGKEHRSIGVDNTGNPVEQIHHTGPLPNVGGLAQRARDLHSQMQDPSQLHDVLNQLDDLSKNLSSSSSGRSHRQVYDAVHQAVNEKVNKFLTPWEEWSYRAKNHPGMIGQAGKQIDQMIQGYKQQKAAYDERSRVANLLIPQGRQFGPSDFAQLPPAMQAPEYMPILQMTDPQRRALAFDILSGNHPLFPPAQPPSIDALRRNMMMALSAADPTAGYQAGVPWTGLVPSIAPQNTQLSQQLQGVQLG